MEAAPFGSITDVSGLRVGHAQRRDGRWQTGTTVVFAPDGATPGVDVRGGGPGTRETDAIAQENLVQRVHAVALSGGSAYGLRAADGVMDELETRGLGVPVAPDTVVPVVPAAVIFDLGRGGGDRHRPDAEFGRRALRGASRSQHRWGAVGAGTGARAGGLQGGVGTASASVQWGDHTVTVGALAVVNAAGTALDRSTGRPWVGGDLRLGRPTRSECDALDAAFEARGAPPLNTTIGVVATSADLTKSEVAKLASVAHDGLARAIRPAHSMFDGDTVFALATGEHRLCATAEAFGSAESRPGVLNLLLAASADTFALACTHAVLAARRDPRRPDAPPGYFDVCASIDPQR